VIQEPPLLFVLVNASRWRASANARASGPGASFPAANAEQTLVDLGGGENPPCVLVHSSDLDGIDADLGQWMQATAIRFADARERYRALTPRERQVFPLITDGLLNKQAASALGISEATLQVHRGRIMHKMGARTFAGLVRIADLLGVSGVDAKSTRTRGPTWTGTGRAAGEDVA
jgi:DNA-binding CsgD family transcriptional regulator